MEFPKGTTIAVADGKRLRVYRTYGEGPQLQLAELPEPKLQPHNKGTGRHHHSGDDNPDERSLEEDSYADAAADWLNQGVLSGDIKKLYIVAPPRTLGELRRHYHKALQAVLLGELGKEHTHDDLSHLHEALVKA
jgi:protein required for attachment to host cells